MSTKVGETRRRIVDLLSKGVTPREIARRLDLSTQAVYEHMEYLRRENGERA